jgi:hypothetical protein
MARIILITAANRETGESSANGPWDTSRCNGVGTNLDWTLSHEVLENASFLSRTHPVRKAFTVLRKH